MSEQQKITDPKEIELIRAKAMAIRKESIIREAVFLDIDLGILGIPIKQFTPYHYLLLDFAINPYLEKHKYPEFEDTCEFLWVVSTKFVKNSEESKNKWILETIVNPLVEESKKLADDKVSADEIFKELRELWNERAVEEIFNYLEEQMMDKEDVPKTLVAGAEPPSYYSWVAAMYHKMASTYRWDRDTFLNTPLPLILQLMRIIKEEELFASGQSYSPENHFSTPITKELFKYINERNNGTGKVVLTDEILRKLDE